MVAIAFFTVRCERSSSRILAMNESRDVVAGRQKNLDRMIGALTRVVKLQTLSQTMRGYPHHGVELGIEALGTPQRIYRDAVFLDLGSGAFEVFLANETEKSS